jgi:hypothetical protein
VPITCCAQTVIILARSCTDRLSRLLKVKKRCGNFLDFGKPDKQKERRSGAGVEPLAKAEHLRHNGKTNFHSIAEFVRLLGIDVFLVQ